MSKYRLWLFLIILIALALRLYNLTYHSLWFDEAISVHWAKQTVPQILEVGFTLQEDRLPPLYYLMLKGWAELFGFSESSIRGLSVVFGVLLVPVVADIAALLFNRRIAVYSSALIALNPFLIWYAQEARMYAPAVFFSSLAIWSFLQVCKSASLQVSKSASGQVCKSASLQVGKSASGQVGKSASEQVCKSASLQVSKSASEQVAYNTPKASTHYALRTTHYYTLFTLSAIAALYCHLYTAFLLPALGLWLVISYPRTKQLWQFFAISGIIITLAYTPILWAIWSFSAEAAPGDPLSGISRRIWWLLQSFTLWKAPLLPTLQTTIPTLTLFFTLSTYLKKSPTPSPQPPTPNPQLPISQSKIKNQKSKILNPPTPQPPTPHLHSPNLPISQSKIKNQKSKILNPRLLITLLLITPFLIANTLLFRNHLAFFGARYFIVMLPWLLILTAVGANNLGQLLLHTTHYALRTTNTPQRSTPHRLLHLPALILLLTTTLPLPGQWSIPASKETWRQSVAYLAQVATPNDGILIHPDWVRYPFQYYFTGPGQTYAAFSNVSPHTALDGPLQGIVADHEIIWLIQSHLDSPDPQRRVEQWFAARYPLVTELYPPGIRLKGYAPGYQLKRLPPQATPINLQFETGLRLVGYHTDTSVTAAETLFHPPSGWLHITLYWTANEPISSTTTPFVHLLGPEGVWGATLERPTDALKIFPPSRWSAPFPIIRHDLDINLNPTTPPGQYQLVLGLQGYEVQYPLTHIEVR